MKHNTCKSTVKTALITSVSLVLSVAQAGEPVTQSTQEDVVFRAFSEFGSDKEIQLVNGVTAKRHDWQTILNAQLSKPGVKPPQTCTGVLVGPGVFLTAAHCLDRGPGEPIRTSLFLEVGGQKLSVNCRMADEFSKAIEQGHWNTDSPRVSQDYAICSFKVPDATPAGFAGLRYENIDIATPLTSGDAVLMTGFGCSDRANLSSPGKDLNLDDQLRIGDASIYAGRIENKGISKEFASIRSRVDSAPVLCQGDSGGPLFSGATASKQTQSRKVRAVNSTFQIVQTDDARLIGVSRVTPLATETFRKFLKSWIDANQHNVICGFNSDPGFLPCRN